MSENLVDRIASGSANLLGVEDICGRLGVSRSTFDRWVRNGGDKLFAAKKIHPALDILDGLRPMLDQSKNLTDGGIKFPPPDIRIGGAPKWEVETLKKWLRGNVTAM